MNLIGGEITLVRFRAEELSGDALLGRLLRSPNRCIAAVMPVGVGKSTAIDNLIESAIRSHAYDLVLMLAPRNAIINERRWVIAPPEDINVARLVARQIVRCGPDNDLRWASYERTRCYQLGREEVCGRCPENDQCTWRRQYGGALKDKQVVFATQAHLAIMPDFVNHIVRWTGATRPLVVLDENSIALSSYRRRISADSLDRYIKAVRSSRDEHSGTVLKQLELLTRARTADLRCPDWNFRLTQTSTQLAVQAAGRQLFGDKYRDLTRELHDFLKSPLASREKTLGGEIVFAVPPVIDRDLCLFTTCSQHRLLEFRLSRPFDLPFEGYCFKHPETRLYNIRSMIGALRYFERNASQIFDFFAQLALLRISEGKRVLFVSKKCHRGFCASEMMKRFEKFGRADLKVVAGEEADLTSPLVLPIIHYGILGVNDFTNFDCAYCLNGFYVNKDILDDGLQDVLAPEYSIDLEIRNNRLTRTRSAGTKRAKDRLYDLEYLAFEALRAIELEVVIQAIGRVRPFTLPREVITMQDDTMDEFLPGVKDFNNLAEARSFFDITTSRKKEGNDTARHVRGLRSQGKTQKQVARLLGLSERQVQRYWHTNTT